MNLNKFLFKKREIASFPLIAFSVNELHVNVCRFNNFFKLGSGILTYRISSLRIKWWLTLKYIFLKSR